jgi:hypothetical protein
MSSAVSLLKGGNEISKGISVVYVTVVLNGRSYVMAEDVAIALARSSQFGSSAASFVAGSNQLQSGGYSATTVISSKPMAR